MQIKKQELRFLSRQIRGHIDEPKEELSCHYTQLPPDVFGAFQISDLVVCENSSHFSNYPKLMCNLIQLTELDKLESKTNLFPCDNSNVIFKESIR